MSSDRAEIERLLDEQREIRRRRQHHPRVEPGIGRTERVDSMYGYEEPWGAGWAA
jgi:hypothetical protein